MYYGISRVKKQLFGKSSIVSMLFSLLFYDYWEYQNYVKPSQNIWQTVKKSKKKKKKKLTKVKGADICFCQNLHHWHQKIIYKEKTGH